MRVQEVTKTYRAGKKRIEALKAISFELPERGMIFLLGRSGSGKSTLLNLLGGMDRPDGGEIESCGVRLDRATSAELDGYRRDCCGFVFQDYNLIPELTVGENVELGLRLQGKGREESGKKAQEALKAVGLEGYEGRKVTELSGGQRQRVAIARAVVKEPELILADEPTGALDEETGKEIFALLKELSKNRLVVTVTHERESAERYGDRVIELKEGKIVCDSGDGGNPDDSPTPGGDLPEKTEGRETARDAKGREKCEKAEAGKRAKAGAGRLPAGTAMRIGVKNFGKHPFRAAITAILSVIAFVFLGISLTIASIDVEEALLNVLKESGQKNAKVIAYEYHETNYTGSGVWIEEFLGGDGNRNSKKRGLTPEEVEKVEKETGANISPVYLVRVDPMFEGFRVAATIEQINEAAKKNPEYCFKFYFEGYLLMNEEECEAQGFQVEGRLPQTPDEVAINGCWFNELALAGLISESGEEIPVTSAADVIGKRINLLSNSSAGKNYKTITGVVHTEEKKISEGHYSNDIFHCVFVSEDYFPEGNRDEVRPGVFEERRFTGFNYGFLSFGEGDAGYERVVKYVLDSRTEEGGYRLSSEATDAYWTMDEGTTVIRNAFLYVALLFFVFSLLLLFNFVSASVRSQQKQVGTLVSLGAGKRELFSIYGRVAVGLFAAVGVVAFAVICIGLSPLNAYLGEIWSFGGRVLFPHAWVFAALVIVAAGVSAAAAFLSVIRTAKEMPAEIIRRGQIK